MNRTLSKAALCSALAALALAGCGGGDDGSSGSNASSDTGGTPAPSTSSGSGGGGGASSDLKLAADPSGQLKFDKTSLTAKAGKVTITMDNPSPVQHAVSIEGNGVDENGKTVGMGGTSTVTATLKPGTYTFFCPVDGHEAAGMKGELTVR